MSVLTRLWPFQRKAAGESWEEVFRRLFGGRETKAGITLTADTAMQVTAVLRCVLVIADGIATVPLKVFRKDASTGRREVATDHPLQDLLAVAPNDWQSGLEFRETLAIHVALLGNAYVFINRVRGQISELLPLDPSRVTVKRGADLRLTYTVTSEAGIAQQFPAEAIWHLRGPSWNSWMGMEPLRMAREAIGLSVALETSHASLHKNGVQSTGMYSVEGSMTPDQYKFLRAWIEQHNAGAHHAGKPLLLDRAAKWTPLTMSGVDAQHLETRRHQIEEICRAFGVMPIMVGYSDKASTYASAEQMFLAHAVHTIRPWHRRFEASVQRSLLTPAERTAGMYPKFLDAELLRGAAKDRSEFYARALGAGGSPAWMEINEVRAFEDMDEVEWGRGQPQPPKPATMPPTPSPNP